MLRFLLLLIFFSGSSLCQAQTQAVWVTVSGQVMQAETNKPLTGVSLVARPSRSGTTTQADGTFRLKARPGDTITFSSVGFQNASYFVSKTLLQANVKIVLLEKSQELQEVEITTRPSAEKINRVLRNMKREPEPSPTKAPPPPQPLFEEKETTPVKPGAISNPASFLYDKYSKEGKERQKMNEILEEKQRLKRDSVNRKKEVEYDKLFLDRNQPFKQNHFYYRHR
ncbi:carboxypeptidase-like regulatory domain-containing protein [Adhaeribacter sp. BT258]|uniref:Carboxypeptidase-like regulatory domain-containing protein n=1 Tax=Adhaeribacter terrigena TaxID=2793070 RepID=A0ABS1C3W9_9BACT|nr:carboxypeptidase-like regulatory domain-containing protein [Adhaeribacter terrigena]MBK0404095.1 carboxypeptidase-like regulatory domain-containing protein [Adhaeribacter terrigena]